MPERFCTMFEKCKFLSMGYISALTQALNFKVIAKDTDNISYTVRYGLGIPVIVYIYIYIYIYLQSPST